MEEIVSWFQDIVIYHYWRFNACEFVFFPYAHTQLVCQQDLLLTTGKINVCKWFEYANLLSMNIFSNLKYFVQNYAMHKTYRNSMKKVLYNQNFIYKNVKGCPINECDAIWTDCLYLWKANYVILLSSSYCYIYIVFNCSNWLYIFCILAILIDVFVTSLFFSFDIDIFCCIESHN